MELHGSPPLQGQGTAARSLLGSPGLPPPLANSQRLQHFPNSSNLHLPLCSHVRLPCILQPPQAPS